MRGTSVLVCALTVAGCQFDTGGVPAEDASVVDLPDAMTQIVDADITVPDADTTMPDASPIDASVADASPPDAAAPDASIPDAAPPDADPCDKCPANTTCDVLGQQCEGIVVFSQGRNGYTGTSDTYIRQSMSGTASGAQQRFQWDADDPFNSGNDNVGLLRFGAIFGAGANQIPIGATITDAKLLLTVLDGSAGPEAADVHESLANWGEAATWNSFGGDPGVQNGELGPVVATIPATACAGCPTVPTTVEIDLTTSLQSFQQGTANRGWVIMPNASDGQEVASSENSNGDWRPRLTVQYAIPLN